MIPGVVLAVLGAGAVGAVARYLVGLAFARSGGLPWAVLIVNTVGSAIAGWMLALTVTASVDPNLALVVLTGLCGGLTTFSTWSVETIQLALEGKRANAVANIVVTLIAGILAASSFFALTLLVVS
jgi:CrcB protein